MKDYSLYPRSSISMSADKDFVKLLTEVIKKYKINAIVESGTFNGKGSTTTIADIIIKNNYPVDVFYTLEVDEKYFNEAVKNLKKFPFVKPIWGLSVNYEVALAFIDSDTAINNHEMFPDVFIDTLINPKSFYTNEIKGQLSKNEADKFYFRDIFRKQPSKKLIFQTNALEPLLLKVSKNNILVLLDSAGGIGYLEFQTVLNALKNNDYILVLDDIHHLKHFRSLKHVQNSEHFELLKISELDGWAIAFHKKEF